MVFGQDLADEASVNHYYLADLHRVTVRLGDRGYRAAELEEGTGDGKVCFPAYALGPGATGLTFLDDEVAAFLSPQAAGKSVMFLAAVGRPGRPYAVS